MTPLRALFSTEIFMARGHEYLWTPRLLVLEGGANLILALAGGGAALALVARRGPASPRARRALAAALALGAVCHLFDVWVIWAPLYWLDALVRSTAAVVAVIAAVALWVGRGDR